METVLVVGANGNTGKRVVKFLKESKVFKPLAMIRKEKQKDTFKALNVDTRLADLEEDLTTVLDGVDRIIFAAGSGGATSKEKTIIIDQESAKRLTDIAKLKAIKKFVMLSSIGADKPERSEDLEDYLRAKQHADIHLRNSGLNYSIVRPGALTDDEGKGTITLHKEFKEQGEISRDDVAQTLVAVLPDNKAK